MFDPLAVDIQESSYRVPGQRGPDLKARALAAYFPPEDLVLTPKNGAYLVALKLPAVVDRLDVVLGPDNWREEVITTPDADEFTVILSARFAPDGDWVSRAGVGRTAELAAAVAAARFGVGRYLESMPHVPTPRMPDGCLPLAYRLAPPESVERIDKLLRVCLAKAKIDEGDWKRAAVGLVKRFGLKSMGGLENRHASGMMNLLGEWAEQIAKGNADCSLSPLWEDPDAPAEQPPPANQPAPKAEEKAPAKGDEKRPDPTSGAKPTSATTSPESPTNTATPAGDPKPAPQPAAGYVPTTGVELLAWLTMREGQLVAAGRLTPGALVSHVVQEAINAGGKSRDVREWKPGGVAKAVGWANEFVLSLSALGKAQPVADGEPLGW